MRASFSRASKRIAPAIFIALASIWLHIFYLPKKAESTKRKRAVTVGLSSPRRLSLEVRLAKLGTFSLLFRTEISGFLPR